MTQIRRGTVLTFDSATWTAAVMLDGSDAETVMPVGEWVPAGLLDVADEVAVLMFGATDSDDGLVLGPYGSVSTYNYPELSGLAVGAVLRATGAGAAAFGAVDLADTDAVTGVLPAANLGASGTWTPVFAGSTTAGVYTYTAQTGYYEVIGGQVFFSGHIVISAIGTPPVGNMAITGLPLTSANVVGNRGCVVFGYISNFKNAVGAVQLTGLVLFNGTQINLFESFTNVAAVQVPAANFTNAGCDLYFNGFYPLP